MSSRTVYEYVFEYDAKKEEEFIALYNSISQYAKDLNISTCVTSELINDSTKRRGVITTGRPDLKIIFNDFECKSKKYKEV